MTEPEDRPGSDDPEDPSELMRLIGRTVPGSPHAGPHRAAADRPEPRAARSGPAEGENVTPDPGPPAPEDRPGPASNGSDTGPGAEAATGLAADTGADTDTGMRADAATGAGADTGTDAGPIADADAEADTAADVDTADQLPPPAELAEDTDLERALEALLLVVDSPVDDASLATALDQPASRVRAVLNRMSLAYTADARGVDLRRAGGGWRFYTRDRYAPYVEKMLLDGQRARLTRAALETLAVVAYRQPVTRARVSAVRGVNCDGVLRTLLTRGLVEEAGTEEQTGGTLFRTTELFLERLGLSSVAELPPLAPLLPDIDAIDDLDGS